MATKAATTKKKTTTTKKATVKAPAKATAPVTVKKTVVAATATTEAADSKSFEKAINDLAFWRALGFELLGTFLLAGAVLITQETPLYVLFAVVAVVLIGAKISGAHINPAVSLGAFLTRRIGWVRLVGYLVAQVLGALLALVVLNAFISGVPTPSASEASLGVTAPTLFKAADISKASSTETWALVFTELLGTGLLAVGAASFLSKVRRGVTGISAAFTYGGATLVALLFAYTTASYFSATAAINPALALSLQAVKFNWTDIAVYIIAPLVGGILGFWVFDALAGRDNK